MSRNNNNQRHSGSMVKTVWHTSITIGFTGCLIALSFAWSLGQTIDFTRLTFLGEARWAIVSGIIIQFGPQVFLYLASESAKDRNTQLRWQAAFWAFTGFDALTNIGARLARISAGTLPTLGTADPQFAELVLWMMIIMGFALDIAVVFAEEMIGHALSVLAQDIAEIVRHLGGRPPRWLYMVGDIADRAGQVPGVTDGYGGVSNGNRRTR